MNRRPIDPIDHDSLNLLRAGDPVGSREVRAGHGWEHGYAHAGRDEGVQVDAVVADIFDHGAHTTVALVVSHGQAEDLADRIRRRLAVVGLLLGPTLTGPGWTMDRYYQAGDRLLLHTRCGDRHSPLVNGTVAVITAVHRLGMDVQTDIGTATFVPAEFVFRQELFHRRRRTWDKLIS
jgi:hypothetical protein